VGAAAGVAGVDPAVAMGPAPTGVAEIVQVGASSRVAGKQIMVWGLDRRRLVSLTPQQATTQMAWGPCSSLCRPEEMLSTGPGTRQPGRQVVSAAMAAVVVLGVTLRPRLLAVAVVLVPPLCSRAHLQHQIRTVVVVVVGVWGGRVVAGTHPFSSSLLIKCQPPRQLPRPVWTFQGDHPSVGFVIIAVLPLQGKLTSYQTTQITPVVVVEGGGTQRLIRGSRGRRLCTRWTHIRSNHSLMVLL
jgi:hypothetical protein